MRVDPSTLIDDPWTYVPVPASSTIVIVISPSSINIICSRKGNTSEEEGTTVTSKGVTALLKRDLQRYKTFFDKKRKINE